MDLGFFHRSRIQLWVWILGPIALLAIAIVPAHMLLRGARSELAELDVLVSETPALKVSIREADAILSLVTPETGSIAAARDDAARRIDESAKRFGLNVRSLKVAEDVGDEPAYQIVKIAVQVQGSLRSIAQWAGEVQRPGLLIGVSAAQVSALGAPPDDTMSGDFTFVLHLRKP